MPIWKTELTFTFTFTFTLTFTFYFRILSTILVLFPYQHFTLLHSTCFISPAGIMPTYRSITISLVSQFDIMSIPEYAPPTAPKHSTSNAPVLINPEHSLVSVYIPTYPSSQFWISYSISPPHPPKALYYFKLFLHGSCVVSWGCSEEDGYRGRTMFAMFDTGEIDKDQALLERRALSFGVETVNATDTKFMEIKVYRSKGRKRIQPQVRGFRETLGPGVKNNIPSGDEEGIQSVDYVDWFCPCTDIPMSTVLSRRV